MEVVEQVDRESQWKLLARINYIAARKTHIAQLMRKETINSKELMQLTVRSSERCMERYGEIVKQMAILTMTVVQDACQQITTLKLGQLADRLLAADKFHRAVEQQLLRRLAWLEQKMALQSKESQGNKMREVCRMCQLGLNYQHLEYLKDSIDRRPDIDLFSNVHKKTEQDQQDFDSEIDEQSLEMIERLLARKNKVLSTEASNLTCFLTEALKNSTNPMKMPVKALSQEQLALMAQSSSMVVGSAIQSLNDNFVTWIKKQLTPILLKICKQYHRRTKAKEKGKMKSQEVQTMENKAVMSTRAFELRIDALSRQLCMKKAEADSLLQQTVKLRMTGQRSKLELQNSLSLAHSKIAELEGQIERKNQEIAKLEALQVDSKQKLKQALSSLNLLRAQAQQLQSKRTTKTRGPRASARVDGKISQNPSYISNSTVMEQIQEEVDFEQYKERSPSNLSSQQPNRSLKPDKSVPENGERDLQTRAARSSNRNKVEPTKHNNIDESYLMKHLPLDEGSPIVEEVNNAKISLAHGVNNVTNIITTRRNPSARKSAAVGEHTYEKSAIAQSPIAWSDQQSQIQSLVDASQHGTQTILKEHKRYEDEPDETPVSVPSFFHDRVEFEVTGKQIPIPHRLTTKSNYWKEHINKTLVDRRSSEVPVYSKSKIEGMRYLTLRNSSLSGLSLHKSGHLSRNATTLQNTPRSSLNQTTKCLPELSKDDFIVTSNNDKENVPARRITPPSNEARNTAEPIQSRTKLTYKDEPVQQKSLNRFSTNLASSHLMPDFSKSCYNFVQPVKRILQAKAVDKQQQLKQISHEEFGVDDLELFMGVAEAYRFETSVNKCSMKNLVDPTTNEEWLRQFFTYFDKQRRTNHQLYINLKNFLSCPYQTAVNRLHNTNDQSQMSYNNFCEQMQGILVLHRKCEKVDQKRRLCVHLCGFLTRVGFDMGSTQAVTVRPLLPALDH